MNGKLVTVIIPVYNGASVINDSVSDVYSQDYPDMELIVVNDGSSDDSSSVLRSLADNAPSNVKVRVIEQENGGICAARNKGLDEATGDYIAFMDQDDRIPSDYISSLMNALSEDDEMVIGGNIDYLADKDKRNNRDFVPEAEWSMYRNTAPWGRLFRKDMIDANNIRFKKTKISEDLYFNFLYLSYCTKGKVKIIPQSGYVWTIRKESESHSNMSRISEDRDVTVILDELINDMHTVDGSSALRTDLFEYMMIKHIVWYLLFVSKGAAKEDVKSVYTHAMGWLESRFPEYRKNPNLKSGKPEGEDKKISLIVRSALRMDKKGLFLPFLTAR